MCGDTTANASPLRHTSSSEETAHHTDRGAPSLEVLEGVPRQARGHGGRPRGPGAEPGEMHLPFHTDQLLFTGQALQDTVLDETVFAFCCEQSLIPSGT